MLKANPGGIVRSESAVSSDQTFRRLWAGETLNLYVEQFIAFAVPLLIVTRFGGSVAQGQIVAFLFFLPYLLLGLNAGVWLEHRSKQRVVVLSALAQTFVLIAVWAAATTSQLGFYSLAALMLLSGVIAVFFQIAYQSYLPTIYSDQVNILKGNSRLALSDAVTRVAAPATAGGLLVWSGVAGSFAAQVALMLMAAALFARMHKDPKPSSLEKRPATGELIREGMVFVKNHDWLNPIIGCGAYYIVFVTAIKGTAVLYLATTGKVSETVAGVAVAFIALGYGLGSALTGSVAARVGTRGALQVSAPVAGKSVV